MAIRLKWLQAFWRLSVGLAVTGATGAVWAQAPARGGETFPTLPEAPDVLTLGTALELAMRGHPGLSAGTSGVRAAEARWRQARVFPNPEIAVGVSEYGRHGNGFDAAETEASLTQRMELGGKRTGRMRQGQAEYGLAAWALEGMRLDIRAETKRRFAAVVAAQARVALATACEHAAERVAFAVDARVQAGKEPPMQGAKAKAEWALARLQRSTEHQALAAATARLTAMWGAESHPFTVADESSLGAWVAPAELEELRAQLSSIPEWRHWADAIRLREASLASARAARTPDVDVSVGLQRFEDDASDAVRFGIALPLPLFDRNHGNVAAARHELDRIREERRAATIDLHLALTDAYTRFGTAHERVKTLGESVVPTMESAFEAAQEGYRQGKFGYLDMLDTQRALFEARAALIDATETYHSARTDLERLTGDDAGRAAISTQ